MNNCRAADLVVPALIIIYNFTNTATEDFQPMNVNFGVASPASGPHPQDTPGSNLSGKGLKDAG